MLPKTLLYDNSKNSLVTTTLSDDCDDINNGRGGDNVDSSTDALVVGNAVSFSHMRSLKYCKIR